MKELNKFYEEKTILVTGGVGSIGKEIVKELLQYKIKAIRVLDNNETGLFDLKQELQTDKLRTFIGDVRDKDRLKRAMEGVDIVFHAAALKHVPLCEYNPFEAVKTNVVGTQNVIEAAMDEDVEKFIMISTDKAVNPINVMGATKLLAERLTISANLYKGKRRIALSCVRFGNVLGSRGSVVPLFMKQIKEMKKITLTDADMTRFVMPVWNAVSLVLKACEMAKGGEIFVLKMPVVKIGDLAEAIIEEIAPRYGYQPEEIEIETIGKRAGEKDYEELMTEDEAINAYEDETMFVILPKPMNMMGKIPSIPDGFKKVRIKKYSSNNQKLLSKEEIKKLLNEIIPPLL